MRNESKSDATFLAMLQSQRDQAAMSVAVFIQKNPLNELNSYIATLVDESNSADEPVAGKAILAAYGLLVGMIEAEERKLMEDAE